MLKLIWKLCIVAVVAIVAGIGLQMLNQNYEDEATIFAVDSESGEFVEDLKIKTYPSLPIKNYPDLAGVGHYKFAISSYSVTVVKLEAKNYKTKYAFIYLKPYDKKQIEMTPKEKKEKDKDDKKDKNNEGKKKEENKQEEEKK